MGFEAPKSIDYADDVFLNQHPAVITSSSDLMFSPPNLVMEAARFQDEQVQD